MLIQNDWKITRGYISQIKVLVYMYVHTQVAYVTLYKGLACIASPCGTTKNIVHII